ncbi:Y-family DNA polymerase [Burkholderia multivorans]|uniref:Y-family DNA polymerase n=1 Tax=Burkholderia multivorans TaxID=87883 RepID=UPI0021BE4F93|nr:DNA polymerase Y family protein [Burkholderia multivorans]MDR8761995.1 Protein ImuB [Burkholderia multivorans]MDR8766203.1 Protein ImuB [Burkholderia multivorans]MDR8770010.1 Protein ImuB [Burkholderia multivorans]MDR8792035.1 Protein ImuB [Burkholderia multivorans]MDR8794564.1 Protein ImuB [Burkholderia multivorans]
MRVFLAVHLPRLQLEAFRPRWLPEPAHGCVVLERDRVVLAGRGAQAAGVRPGMRRGGVLTMSPDIEVHERDVAREDDILRAVAVALMRFSPDVVVCDEGTVLVDVTASLRLFGGVTKLCHELAPVIDAIGVTARISAAPTGQGAWLLAHYRSRRLVKLLSLERALSALPLTAVSELRPFSDWFTGLGCSTIADVRRLPRAGLQRRCGQDVLDSLDRAFGLAPELYEWMVLPETFAVRVELPDRIEHAEAVLFAARRLVAQLCGWLAARQLAVSGLTLQLEHERGPQSIAPTEIRIAVAEPVWHDEYLVRLMKEWLARTELAAPVIAVGIETTKVSDVAPMSDTLFPEPGGSPGDHARLIGLLTARLGEANVLRPAPTADHRPEIANRWVPLGDAWKSGSLPVNLPRPTWLLDAPVQLVMRRHRPVYGTPLYMVSPGERIEAGWYDGRLVTRDYFVARAEDHACYWVYRERVGSRDGDEPRWYLHGLFG